MINPSRIRVSQRKPSACTECTRRKVACDKKIPCGRCVRLNKNCFREIVRTSKSLSANRAELVFLRGLSSRLREHSDVQKTLQEIHARITTLELGDGDSLESISTPYLQHDADETNLASDNFERGQTDSPGASKATREASVSICRAGLLEASETETENGHILQAVEFLAWGRHSETCYPHRSCKCAMYRSHSELASINCDLERPGFELVSALINQDFSDVFPPVNVAKKIITFHLDYILWHHNTFHAPTFLAQCERFWIDGLVVDNLWISLYLSVLSTTIWSILNSDRSEAIFGFEYNEKLVEKLFRAMLRALYDGNFLENFSMFSIQAIMISTRVAHSLGLSTLHATMAGAAVRIAHCMGLHKISVSPMLQPVQSTRDCWFESVEREVGKRTWNQLIIQDHFRIPFTDTYIIHPNQYVTELPMNCEESDFIEKPDDHLTINSFIRYLSKIASMMPLLLNGLKEKRDFSPPEIYEHILRIDDQMRQCVRHIPPCLMRETENSDSLPVWVPLARRSLAIDAADKIIMIHRPILFLAFHNPRFSRTRLTCIAAATTILREHQQASAEKGISIWTHSAFCVTAAMVMGLELLHRRDHTDDQANEIRQMLIKTRKRLATRRGDVIGERAVWLIDTILEAEEDLVIKVMRCTRNGESIELTQRKLIDDMIQSHELMVRFLALDSNNSDTSTPGKILEEQSYSLDWDLDTWFTDTFESV